MQPAASLERSLLASRLLQGEHRTNFLMHNALKTLFASLVLSLCLTVPLSATESSPEHDGTAAATLAAPAGTDIDERVHLGLDRHEQNNSLVCELPALPATTATPGAGTDLPAANLSPDWMASGASRPLSLDAPEPARPSVATMDPISPAGEAANSNAGESWMYVGMGVLLVALAWVCVTGVRQHRSSVPWTPGDEGAVRLRRAQRAKMVVYKP